MKGINLFVPAEYCDHWNKITGKCVNNDKGCLHLVGKSQCACYCLKNIVTGAYFNAFPVQDSKP